jgi:hypothetical protein
MASTDTQRKYIESNGALRGTRQCISSFRVESVQLWRLAVNDGIFVVAISDRKSVSPASAAGRSMEAVQMRNETLLTCIEQVDRRVLGRRPKLRMLRSAHARMAKPATQILSAGS